jgi:hypothetical protein
VGDKIVLFQEYASFNCPGCNTSHTVSIKQWQWNGSASEPTFTPSILVKSGHYSRPGDCWCTFNAAHPDDPSKFTCFICHSYVTGGKIQFLPDCTHALKGQTVELPDWVNGF